MTMPNSSEPSKRSLTKTQLLLQAGKNVLARKKREALRAAAPPRLKIVQTSK